MNKHAFSKTDYKVRRNMLTEILNNNMADKIFIPQPVLKDIVKRIPLDQQYVILHLDKTHSKNYLKKLQNPSLAFKFNITILYQDGELSSCYFDNSNIDNLTHDFKQPLIALFYLKKHSVIKKFIIISS